MKNEMWLIWKQPESRRRYKVGTLKYDNEEYIFEYTNPELNDAHKAGFEYFPGFDNINEVYKSVELFANIETRLPNPKRPDYLEILNAYNLKKDSSKLEILKATKGRLLTDNYEFVPSFDTDKIEFDVAGTRYCKEIKKCINLIKINDKLLLELEPDNIYDQNAIKVILEKNGKKYHLGYVPRYYAKYLSNLLKNNIKYSAMIQSLNFESKFNDEDINAYVKLIFD